MSFLSFNPFLVSQNYSARYTAKKLGQKLNLEHGLTVPNPKSRLVTIRGQLDFVFGLKASWHLSATQEWNLLSSGAETRLWFKLDKGENSENGQYGQSNPFLINPLNLPFMFLGSNNFRPGENFDFLFFLGKSIVQYKILANSLSDRQRTVRYDLVQEHPRQKIIGYLILNSESLVVERYCLDFPNLGPVELVLD